MKRIRRSLVFSLLLVSLAWPVFGQGTGTVEHIKVHGKSLEGNLEGDSPDRDVFVYLPPSYFASHDPTNSGPRYPVVYLLHGYGLTAERWMSFANLAGLSDKDLGAGTMKEMILVSPDAHTIYDGSMYSASPTTGDWETFIAEDLVSYIDSHYRTIPDRMSRGLGGHSMGGYGTVRIGMKRPDVFSSLYIMSACCLLTNPYAQANRGAAPASAPAGTPGRGEQAGAGSGQGRGQGSGQGSGRGRGFANVGSAQAAAWASNPSNPPKYFDMPTKDGAVQPLIAAKYLANSPLVMIDQYVTNLKKYRAIAGDVGTEDGLAASNRQMDEIFTSFGIKHTFETYEGDHTNHVKDRFEQKVLPFFSNNLSFAAAKK